MVGKTRSGPLVALALGLFWASGAVAAAALPPVAPATANHTRLTLLADSAAVQPRRAIRLGLLFDLDPHWHIYWINPGDSGEPPGVTWRLPTGFQAGDLEWPVPERLSNGPLTDYGYQNTVLLMSEVRVPAGISEPKVNFAADVHWLVCSDVCITAKTSVSLDLPVQRATSKRESRSAGLFRAAQQALPRSMPALWRVTAEDQGSTFEIRLRTGTSIRNASFFPLEFNEVENSKPQNAVASATGVDLTVYKSDQLLTPIRQLRGVMVIDGGRAYQLTAAVERSGARAD